FGSAPVFCTTSSTLGGFVPAPGGGYAFPLPVGSVPDPQRRKQMILPGKASAIWLHNVRWLDPSVLISVLASGAQSNSGSNRKRMFVPAYTRLTRSMTWLNSCGVTV